MFLVFLEVKIDDEVQGKVLIVNAKELINVKVWSGLRYFFKPYADVDIRNLQYESGEKNVFFMQFHFLFIVFFF